MDLIGALFMVLAVAFLVALFVSQPFLMKVAQPVKKPDKRAEDDLERQLESKRSALMAERDRILNSLQDLDFDHALGKVPEEDYPWQREAFMHEGAEVLRQLDELQPAETAAQSALERLEAAVSARRADRAAARPVAVSHNGHEAVATAPRRRPVPEVQDDVETLVSERRRAQPAKAAGFCPHCGKPVAKTDKFCSKCGATI